MNVSYIIAGKEKLDFAVAVSKIQKIYGKDELLLNGGGGVNWSLLKQGLVAEVSGPHSGYLDSNSYSCNWLISVSKLPA